MKQQRFSHSDLVLQRIDRRTLDFESRLNEMQQSLNTLLRRQGREEKELMAFADDLKAKLDALNSKVGSLTTVAGSAEALLNGLTSMIADLKAQLLNSGVDPALLVPLDAANDAIDARTAELAASVAANTPAA